MRAGFFAIGLALAGISPAFAAGTVGDYDALLLSLSWSPSFCEGRITPEQQCDPQRRIRPFGLVVHGLWPQYDREGEKGYPDQCIVVDKVPEALVEAMLPLMPSQDLMNHEWRKHGSCYSTAPEPYFAEVQRLYESFVVPERLITPETMQKVATNTLRQDIRQANPALPEDGFILRCSREKLQEIRICYDQDSEPMACPSMVQKQDNCGDTVRIPAVRP